MRGVIHETHFGHVGHLNNYRLRATPVHSLIGAIVSVQLFESTMRVKYYVYYKHFVNCERESVYEQDDYGGRINSYAEMLTGSIRNNLHNSIEQ